MRKSVIFLLILCLFIALPLPYLIPGIGQADFIAYWSAVRLLVDGRDPYNLKDISEIQIEQFPERETEEGDYVIVAWNPPWLNLLFLPLGYLEFETAAHIWLYLNILLIGISVLLTWDQLIKPFDHKGFIWILVVSLFFIEVLISLIIGQVTSIVLSSLVLSVWLIRKKLDMWAGISLAFTLIKPHLIFFPLLLILIWTVRSRRWKILFGSGFLVLVSATVMWLFIPNWITEYTHLLTNLSNYRGTTGTIGNFFSSMFGIRIFNYAFLLVLPLTIPFIKMLGDPLEMGALNASILISLFLAPYGFGIDHILAIPAFVQIYAWIRNSQFSLGLKVKYLLVYIMINFIIIIFLYLRFPPYWAFLFPFIYLVLFIYIWHRYRGSKSKLSIQDQTYTASIK